MNLVNAGVPVGRAAGELGLAKRRADELLKTAGRGQGPTTTIADEHRRVVAETSPGPRSVKHAAISAGLSHDAARRILVTVALMSAARTVVGNRLPRLGSLTSSSRPGRVRGRRVSRRQRANGAGLGVPGRPQEPQHADPSRWQGRGLCDRDPPHRRATLPPASSSQLPPPCSSTSGPNVPVATRHEREGQTACCASTSPRAPP